MLCQSLVSFPQHLPSSLVIQDFPLDLLESHVFSKQTSYLQPKQNLYGPVEKMTVFGSKLEKLLIR